MSSPKHTPHNPHNHIIHTSYNSYINHINHISHVYKHIWTAMGSLTWSDIQVSWASRWSFMQISLRQLAYYIAYNQLVYHISLNQLVYHILENGPALVPSIHWYGEETYLLRNTKLVRSNPNSQLRTHPPTTTPRLTSMKPKLT